MVMAPIMAFLLRLIFGVGRTFCQLRARTEAWSNTSGAERGHDMLRMALLFLIIALVAGALGLFGVAAVSSEIAWLLFAVFLILFVVSLVFSGPWTSTGPPV